MTRIFVLFVALLGVLCAQEQTVVDIQSIAKPLDNDAARQVWTSIDGGVNTKTTNRMAGASGGLSDLRYPQAAGVVQVVAEPNFGRNKTIRFFATKPVRGIIAARAVLANGDSFSYQVFDLDRCCGPSQVSMELWSGAFPANWPVGTMKFQVFHIEAGRISEAIAYVNVGFNAPYDPGPQIGNIYIVNDDKGEPVLITTGSFKSQDLAVMVGFVPGVKFSVNPFGQLRVPLLEAVGDTTLTVCEGGICTTRTFFANPNPFPTQPPFSGPPPGKG